MKFLKQKIRDLEKEKRRLQRENSALKKHAHMYEESQYEDPSEDTPEVEVITNYKANKCPECEEGYLKETELMPGKILLDCTECNYRRTKK